MDPLELDNFLFVPESPGIAGGCLYELTLSDRFAANSFVLLPYQNPQVKIPEPVYYSILKKTFIEDATPFVKKTSTGAIVINAGVTKNEYLQRIKKLKNEIRQGNIYEINYCTNFFAEHITIDPWDIFLKLNKIARAPYCCLLKTGNDVIICASPELFLSRQGDVVYTKPIKGTIRRGVTENEDRLLKDELYYNIKERTENVMAVDVARNDLSRFAEKGTVQVNKLYNIETFETVHQMVSTVSCRIHPDLLKKEPEDLFDTIIDATFPMASMTGAPKLRAMQLIDACESFERNVYSGAMGLIDENKNFVLSVIIRSIFYNQQTKILSFAVGSAITYLSEAEKEYDECLLKAAALLKALNAELA